MAGPGWLLLMSGDRVCPCGWLAGANKDSEAHVAGANWGRAPGRIKAVRRPVGLSLCPVLSGQPQPGWAGRRGLTASPPALFLSLTSRQSHSEAARPHARDMSPTSWFLTGKIFPPSLAPPSEAPL